MTCHVIYRKTVIADLRKDMWNLALQPLKTSYLHYHNLYRHQSWQDGDLTGGTLTHNVTRPFDHVILRNHLKVSPLPEWL